MQHQVEGMTKLKPEQKDLKKAKRLAEKGIEKAQGELPKNEEVKVGFSWTEEPFALENMNGVSGKSFGSHYFHVSFNSDVKMWKKALIGTAIHEYGHTYFYENIEQDYSEVLWRYILDEALTQNLTKKLAPESPEPWRTAHSIEEIAQYWPEIKEQLDREVNHPDPLYINKDDEGFPNWLGYSLSFRIGQKILEDYNLEEFPNLDKQHVVKAGNKLFDEGKN